jgi:predicted nucleotidyltransferase
MVMIVEIEKLKDFFEADVVAGVVSAYLFGSHASGRAHRESDVDVGVLLDRGVHPTKRDRFEARLRLLSELGTFLKRDDVDLVVLNDASPELSARVVSHGTRVFCRRTEADHAFVRDAQLLAADLKPFLERMRRIKLEAIRR